MTNLTPTLSPFAALAALLAEGLSSLYFDGWVYKIESGFSDGGGPKIAIAHKPDSEVLFYPNGEGDEISPEDFWAEV